MQRLSIFIFILIGLNAQAQQRYYVNQQANTGLNNGLSWPDAFTDLHSALQAATTGDEIWVAQGLYRTDTANTRNRAFDLRSGVRLLGGFTGYELDAAARQPDQHTTILSGNIGNPADSLDNALTVLYLALPDSSTLVSGFVIEHGYANTDTSYGNVSPSRAGGGAYILANDSTAYPMFDRCTFRNNYAGGNGGAVMVRSKQTKGSAPRFRHCKFINNKSGANGGAIWYQGGSHTDVGTKFYDCEFLGNKSGANGAPGTLAGGIYYTKVIGTDTLSFVKCRFVQNQCTGIAGCIAVANLNFENNIILDSCFISKNRTTSTTIGLLNGTFMNSYLGSSSAPNGLLRITNCEFFQQTSSQGDYTHSRIIYHGNTSLEGLSFFRNNIIKQSTGIIDLGSSKLLVLTGNIVTETDSVLYGFRTQEAQIHNNFLAAQKNTLVITSIGQLNASVSNNTIISSPNAQGSSWATPLVINVDPNNLLKHKVSISNNIIANSNLSLSGFQNITDSSNLELTLQNNIFLNNTEATTGAARLPIRFQSGKLTYSHNMSDTDCSTLLGSSTACGSGNIVVNEWPFVDTANLDFRLRACAPGINGGTAEILQLLGIDKDIQGQPRIQGTAPDMGPYEQAPYTISAQFTISPTCGNVASGSALPILEGGCPPYTFAWSGPTGQGGGSTLAGLAAGQYTVTVRDAIQNEVVAYLAVPGYPAVTIPGPTVTWTQLGQSTGAISLDSTDWQQPFSVAWSNGGTGATIVGLAAGNYTATITDGNGCTASETFTVGTVSAGEALAFNDFRLSPNPAQGHVLVQGAQVEHFQIFGTNGSAATGLLQPNTRTDISTLPPGVYVVVVMAHNGARGRARFVVF
jgi:hypothetical protein